MAVKILRRLKAVHDAEKIADYLAKDSLEVALRFLENVEATLSFLAENPLLGSRFESEHPRLSNLRIRRVQGFPNHVIIYAVHRSAIEVLNIMHGARDIDSALESSK